MAKHCSHEDVPAVPAVLSAPFPPETVSERRSLRARHEILTGYLREKVNQLLRVLGTWPLQPEELDDQALIALDPIGTIAEAFSDVLLHLRRTNQDLTSAHDEIRAIVEAAGAGIIVVDPESRVLGYNTRIQNYFFHPDHVVLGQPLDELCNPPIAPPSDGFFNVILKERTPLEHRDFTHRERHFHLVGSPVVGPLGEVSKVVLVYTDITARSRIEASLKEAEARLQTIFNSVPVGILVLDAESHRVADVNDSALEVLGHSKDSLLGRHCRDFLWHADRTECPVPRDGNGRDSSERTLLHADGHGIPVMKTVTRVLLDGREHLLESFIDISERKRAEQALQESEERYRSLYAAMKEGVALHEILADDGGNARDFVIVDVNPAYERLLNLSRDQVLGMLGSQVYGIGDPPFLERFARIVRTGAPETFEVEFRGRYFYLSAFRPEPGKFATILDDVTERKRAEQQVQRLAYSDTLTGLPNRVLLLERLRDILMHCAREDAHVAVLFLDLDRFKPINDTLGHSVGDALLKAVAERLQRCVRRSDTVARLGGDEFVVLLTGSRGRVDATSAARKILERFAEPFVCEGHEIFISVSIGIAAYPEDGQDPSTLLKSADMAMYAAKERCRNTFQFYSDEMNRNAQERLELETSVRRALKHGEFFLCYQPQLTLGRGWITGVEALVRWSHPELGVVPPGRFIPMCEETGLILPLGEWVLRQACTRARAWQDQGLAGVRMAVNLSGVQFRQADLLQCVGNILAETRIDPSTLEIELTESILMEDADETVKTLRRLKDMGLRLAIDDFGTGYSSLSYLSSFPIDRIKIAQRFVQHLPEDAGDAAIVETIIAIAHSLNIEVIAEGVETRQQLQFLWSRGCTDVQGYYFARPLPGEPLTQTLREWAQPGGVCPFRLT